MSSVLKSEKSALCLVCVTAPFSGSTTSSPCRALSMASRATTQPLPPASTTPAFFSTGFWLTVSASAFTASSMAASWTNSIKLFSRAASAALAADRRATVRMVPSAGFMTAL